MLRIAVCDSTKSVCDRFAKLFLKHESFFVAGVANNVENCKNIIAEEQPDVLILSTQLKNDDGIEAISELLEINPELKIIMVAPHIVEDEVFRIFASGAKDMIHKTMGDSDIINKVESVYNGTATLAPEIAGILAKKSRDVMNRQNSLLYTINQITKLSKSELNVLREVYYGKTYREIAANRFVEEGTIRAQASGIMKKFQTKSMKNLIRTLKEMELFEFIDLYYENSGKQ